jgi:uncharacterized membrane protein YccF (DUF307 family)
MAVKVGSTVGNLVWFIFGGALMALSYLVAGVLNCITIIGIPNGLQSFKLAKFAWWPFGKDVVEASEGGTSCLGTLGNVIWFLVGGWWLALSHVLWGLLLFLPIVTIPFGRRHFEMVPLALFPFGKKIVEEPRMGSAE